jgi:hypothetical protein
VRQQHDAHDCVKLLHQLHLKVVLADAAETVASEEISREVSERCSDCFDKACLSDLQQWLLQTLVIWSESIIDGAAAGSVQAAVANANAPSPAPSWSQRLQRRLAQCVITCRTPQLFDMVKECVAARCRSEKV